MPRGGKKKTKTKNVGGDALRTPIDEARAKAERYAHDFSSAAAGLVRDEERRAAQAELDRQRRVAVRRGEVTSAQDKIAMNGHSGEWRCIFAQFRDACRRGDGAVMERLWTARPRPNPADSDTYGWSALHLLARRGEFKWLERILSESAQRLDETNKWGETILHCAAAGGHTAVVELLLFHGAAPALLDEDGNTPLLVASEAGHADTARYLRQHRVFCRVAKAAQSGELKAVRVLLDAAKSAKERDDDVYDNDSADALDIDFRGAHRLTPFSYSETLLHSAVRFGDGELDVARMLLERYGANVNARDYPRRNTPLQLACARGHMGLVRLMLEHGADVNAVEFQGVTPLACAAFGGYIEIVRVLLEHGARTDVPTNDRHIAADTSYTKIREMIQAWDARHDNNGDGEPTSVVPAIESLSVSTTTTTTSSTSTTTAATATATATATGTATGTPAAAADDIASECQVCMDAARDVAFGPCGHVVACQLCADKLDACPICKARIASRLRIFIA